MKSPDEALLRYVRSHREAGRALYALELLQDPACVGWAEIASVEIDLRRRQFAVRYRPEHTMGISSCRRAAAVAAHIQRFARVCIERALLPEFLAARSCAGGPR